MVKYTCKRCGKSFKQKGHYTKHNNKKNKCQDITNIVDKLVEKKIIQLADSKVESNSETKIEIENILGIGLLLGIGIFIISVVLVSNTIRLIIHAKQDTVEILHLLGATNSFIRFPFVVEGIMQGLIGTCLSLLMLLIFSSIQSYLLEPLIRLPIIAPSTMMIYNFIFGLLLALIGSYRGIAKYLPK